MTEDHRGRPAGRAGGSARRRAPRLLATTALVVLAGVGGTWGELKLVEAPHSGQSAGSASQDAAGPSGADSAAAVAGSGPSVAELLPETRIADAGYQAVRTATRQGANCADLYAQALSAQASSSAGASATPTGPGGAPLTAGSSSGAGSTASAGASMSATASASAGSSASAAAGSAQPDPSAAASAAAAAEAAAKTPGCQGYAGASYVTGDHSIYTSVTILGFANEDAAARAAAHLTATDIGFEQPGAGYAALATQTGGDGVLAGTVRSIGRYVTVTVSAYADGRAADEGLRTATDDVSYTAGSALLWL